MPPLVPPETSPQQADWEAVPPPVRRNDLADASQPSSVEVLSWMFTQPSPLTEPELEAGSQSESLETPPTAWESNSKNGSGQWISAAVGGGLLLLGLFLPMATGPLGISMSFVDPPWKAITFGFQVADWYKEAGPGNQRESSTQPPPIAKITPSTASKGVPLFTVLLVTALLYPFIIAICACLAFLFGFASNRSYATAFLGLFCLIGTLVYAVELILLNGDKEARSVLLFTSPGVGWASLLIGSLILCGSFFARSRDSRRNW